MALSQDTDGTTGGAERDARLSRVYQEAARNEPPAHLDAAILAAARREAGARPRRLGAALRRWRVPVSIAAVVVLSVSLVKLMQEESADRLSAPTLGAPSLQRQEETPPPAPAGSAAKGPRESASIPASPAGEEFRASTPPVAREAPEIKRPAAAPLAEQSAGPALRPEPGAAPPPPFPAAPAGQGAVPAPRADRESATRPAAVPEDTARARSELRALGSDRPAAVQSARPVTAAPPEAGRAKEAELAPDAARPAFGDRPPVWLAFEREPPQKWLERIGELRREGQTAAADEMLAEFKRRFPGYPLPGAMR